ncbi:MAG: hypothetical protein KJP23_17400 [Deltaproteobacteria bacterium]|nr:hypothetical protein [Deltaproteobacteria bacterium]
MVGYSRLMSEDEVAPIRTLAAYPVRIYKVVEPESEATYLIEKLPIVR